MKVPATKAGKSKQGEGETDLSPQGTTVLLSTSTAQTFPGRSPPAASVCFACCYCFGLQPVVPSLLLQIMYLPLPWLLMTSDSSLSENKLPKGCINSLASEMGCS